MHRKKISSFRKVVRGLSFIIYGLTRFAWKGKDLRFKFEMAFFSYFEFPASGSPRRTGLTAGRQVWFLFFGSCYLFFGSSLPHNLYPETCTL